MFRDMDGGSSGGAGISALSCDLDVVSCEFRDLSGSVGAGIYQDEADLLVDSCIFVNCEDRAVRCIGHTVGTPEGATIVRSSFIGNAETSTGGGGAIIIVGYESGVTVMDCVFQDNVAVGAGGAVSIASFGVAPYLIQGCVFWNNRTTIPGGGGGALLGDGDGSVFGCTFDANEGLGGGAAVALQNGTVAFENNVVTGSIGAAAVWQIPSATVSPDCNVYWGNVGGNMSGFTMASTSRTVDPSYCDPSTGDFRVAQVSPCLPANSLGCGLIGALGQGCAVVGVEGAVDSHSWARIKAGYR
jgi:hypothetical protein